MVVHLVLLEFTGFDRDSAMVCVERLRKCVFSTKASPIFSQSLSFRIIIYGDGQQIMFWATNHKSGITLEASSGTRSHGAKVLESQVVHVVTRPKKFNGAMVEDLIDYIDSRNPPRGWVMVGSDPHRHKRHQSACISHRHCGSSSHALPGWCSDSVAAQTRYFLVINLMFVSIPLSVHCPGFALAFGIMH